MGLLTSFKEQELIHHWKKIVGPSVASHCQIIDIKPPSISISVDTSVWLQQMNMQKRQLLNKINDFYKDEIITEIRLQIKRISTKVEEEQLLDYEIEADSFEKIDFSTIVLTEADVREIDEAVRTCRDEKKAQLFRNILIRQKKKKIYLLQKGYKECEDCGVLIKSERPICMTCLYKRHRKIIRYIKYILNEHPHSKLDDIIEKVPFCTYEYYREAKREIIYYYLDRIYRGSENIFDLYQATMLITCKKREELSDEFVVNLTNKYRSKWIDKEKIVADDI